MELSKYKQQRDATALETLEPGVYDFEYAQDEKIEGRNGWVALKVFFRVVDKPNFLVGHSFTLEHDTSEQAIEIGLQSLDKLAKVCGFPDGLPDDSSDLVGSKVRANVIIDDKGYPAIDDGKGKGWLEPKSKPVKSEKKSEPETKESGDENIPF